MSDKVKILVVEDEGIIAMTISIQLEGLGYEVVGIADSSDKAIEIIEKNKPDIILMDIVIKGDMNGIDLGRLVSEKYGCGVIYISGTPDAISAGVRKSGYLPKPFSEDQLREVVQKKLA